MAATEISRAFGARLTKAWKDAGHASSNAAAIASGTTPGYFKRLCDGESEPSIGIVQRMADAFKVDAGELAFGARKRKGG